MRSTPINVAVERVTSEQRREIIDLVTKTAATIRHAIDLLRLDTDPTVTLNDALTQLGAVRDALINEEP